jgi:hypothetical protein
VSNFAALTAQLLPNHCLLTTRKIRGLRFQKMRLRAPDGEKALLRLLPPTAELKNVLLTLLPPIADADVLNVRCEMKKS